MKTSLEPELKWADLRLAPVASCCDTKSWVQYGLAGLIIELSSFVRDLLDDEQSNVTSIILPVPCQAT